MPFTFYETDSFDCSDNGIKTLADAPRKINGNFRCVNTYIDDFTNGPEWVGGNVDAWGTYFSSAKGFPKFVGGNVRINVGKAFGYIPLLFSEIHGKIIVEQTFFIKNQELTKILNDRNNGKVPRERIPGLINEIRDLVRYEKYD